MEHYTGLLGDGSGHYYARNEDKVLQEDDASLVSDDEAVPIQRLDVNEPSQQITDTKGTKLSCQFYTISNRFSMVATTRPAYC